MKDQITQLCREAKAASRPLSRLKPKQIDAGLAAIAETLENRKSKIAEANDRDIAAAEKRKIAKPLVDRLRLIGKPFDQMVEGLRQIIALPCPLGEVTREWTRPNGLKLSKVRVPIGVIGIIYESRPNVTVDAAALCLKAGNAVVLRGGSEAFATNEALVAAMKAGATRGGLPEASVQFIPTTDRTAITELCRQSDSIDLIIPRGGKTLVDLVRNESRIPVIAHSDGICHVYVHAAADLKMAGEIVINAKCQKPAVCNAVETLLVDEKIAAKFVPQIVKALQGKGVEIRGDEATQKLAGAAIKAATDEDWKTEYLDLILSIRIVPGINAAIEHVEKYGSHHSDAIVTEDKKAAEHFFEQVDSATVFWNASTRFNDGFEFGFGAEIGISTDKLHARGPMGLEELTSYKYIISGSGQVRS